MTFLTQLWNDEAGLVLSAEMVTIGTLGVLGATAGLSLTADAVNEELADVARAIRSLDQSYCVSGYQTTHCNGGQAFTAGSSYQQEPVEDVVSRIQLTPNPDPRQRAEVEDRGTLESERSSIDESQVEETETKRLRTLE